VAKIRALAFLTSMGRIRDLSGQKFGRQTVRERLPELDNYSRVVWVVECECGRKKPMSSNNIVRGAVSCGEDGCRGLPPGLALRNHVLLRYKKSAEKFGRAWELSGAQFDALIADNCHYCGVPPNTTFSNGKMRGSLTYNGIDRKDNALGYVEFNVVTCCKICNRAKLGMTYEAFKAYIAAVRFYGQTRASHA
jgi:hypothetical protein